MFALAAGDEQAVATRLDQVLGYAGRSVSALSDGSSLLWRLHLDGRSLGDLPWQALSALPSPPGFTFSNLHRAFVLAGVGDVDELRTYATTLTSPLVQVCLAIADLVADEPKLAADRLLEHEADFVTIGGSRAQLDVVDDTLIVSLARSGRVEEARQRLSLRLSLRLSARASKRDRR